MATSQAPQPDDGPRIAPSRQSLDNRFPVLAFTVHRGDREYFEVLLATDRALFAPANAARRNAGNFYSSRQDSGLVRAAGPTAVYLAPAAVLRAFAQATPRPTAIYYTLITYRTADGTDPAFAQPPETLPTAAPSVSLSADFRAQTLANTMGVHLSMLRRFQAQGQAAAPAARQAEVSAEDDASEGEDGAYRSPAAESAALSSFATPPALRPGQRAVAVGAALARPTGNGHIVGGETGDNTPRAAVLAGALAGPQRALFKPLRSDQQKPPDFAGDTAGKRFGEGGGAVSAQQGTAAFTDVVSKVNFPSFVGGLIDGVFNAIVTSSIKQMQAYAELVKNVAKSVDQYMKDNVTENQARDYLADRYPGYLEVDISGDKPTLKPKEGYDEDNLPDFFSDLGLKEPVQSLDDDTVEQQLVPAARRRMAMDRQQLLATMVLMGINRLVVTDGHIEASVLFELNTTDLVKRRATRTTDFGRASQSAYDYHGEGSYSRSGSEGGFLGIGGDDVSQKSSWYSDFSGQNTAQFNVSTAQSEDSQSKVDLHAKLTGKVSVNFKSDYFPLEKIADVLQINQIREKSPGAAAAVTAPRPPRAAAPAAPAPAAAAPAKAGA
jgi:hypothetical protein